MAKINFNSWHYCHCILRGLELHRGIGNRTNWCKSRKFQKANDDDDAMGNGICYGLCYFYKSCLWYITALCCTYHSAVANVQWEARHMERNEMVFLCLLSPALNNLRVHTNCVVWEHRSYDRRIRDSLTN